MAVGFVVLLDLSSQSPFYVQLILMSWLCTYDCLRPVFFHSLLLKRVQSTRFQVNSQLSEIHQVAASVFDPSGPVRAQQIEWSLIRRTNDESRNRHCCQRCWNALDGSMIVFDQPRCIAKYIIQWSRQKVFYIWFSTSISYHALMQKMPNQWRSQKSTLPRIVNIYCQLRWKSWTSHVLSSALRCWAFF